VRKGGKKEKKKNRALNKNSKRERGSNNTSTKQAYAEDNGILICVENSKNSFRNVQNTRKNEPLPKIGIVEVFT